MAIQAQLCSDNLGFPFCGSQDWIIDHGCGGFGGFSGFYSNLQQKQQLQQQQQQQQHHVQQLQNEQQRNHNLFFDNRSLVSTSKNNTGTTNNDYSHAVQMLYSQGIASQFEKQRQETDLYIRLQNERLRLALEEQRKEQLAQLLKKIESKALFLLRQKDEEIVQATRRTMELEEFLTRMEAENQAWQRVAQENEAMVVSLNNTLEQVREAAPCGFNDGAEDAESCCDMNEEREDQEEEAEENRGGLYDVEHRKKTVCKSCNSRRSCMLFLPCRHLCSCKACEALLDSCPVCRTEKKATIEALIF